jgi:uncharacterized membrane protein
MYNVIVFLHVVSAVLLGFYVLFPFAAGRVGSLNGETQQGYVGLLSFFNRVGQFTLIASFLTGGYLAGRAGLSGAWMATSVVLLVALGAVSGIVGANLKRLNAASQNGSSTAAAFGKVKALSWVGAVIVIVILYVMVNRW